ncbi:Spo0E family sporulation regulatory protein-aspartic acid phosphatase [Paenibacillus elgii]|nr:Spo0E family sporulation regulatory protein-aspartic acid phosphatase [Paenibacillus elgii]
MQLEATGKEAAALPELHHLNDEALQSEMKSILSQMEDAVKQGESLTCGRVVALSQRLDKYIVVAQIRSMPSKRCGFRESSSNHCCQLNLDLR